MYEIHCIDLTQLAFLCEKYMKAGIHFKAYTDKLLIVLTGGY